MRGNERAGYSMYDREPYRMAKRLENSGVANRYLDWTFDSLDPYVGDTIDRVKLWVDDFVAGRIVDASGRGLLLHGKPGHGKTALSSVALLEALRASQRRSWGSTWDKPYQPYRGGFWTPYRSLIQMTQRQFNKGTSEDDDNFLLDVRGARSLLTGIRLLVLDDVGKEHRTASGWAQGFFEDLIRTRYYTCWPTIITTNVSPDEFTAEYGESCGSFLREGFTSIEVECPLGDRRLLDASR